MSTPPQSQPSSPTPLPEQLQYPWPPNLSLYEAKVWLGLSAQQALLLVMGTMIPMATLRSEAGFVLAVGVGMIIYLSFKKIGRFGGISLPVYIWLRLLSLLQREEEVMELPLIIGGGESVVEIENWEGDTLMIVGAEE